MFSAGPHTPVCAPIHTSCHIHQSVSRDNRTDRFAQRLLDHGLSSNPSSNQWSFLYAFIITEFPDELNRIWAVGQNSGGEAGRLRSLPKQLKYHKFTRTGPAG